MPYRAYFPLWEMGQIFPVLFPKDFPKAPSLQAEICMWHSSTLSRILLHSWLRGKTRHKRSQSWRDWNLFLTLI